MTATLTNCEPWATAQGRVEQTPSDAYRHLEAFLATLGHEMRNPLGALSNAMELLPMAIEDPAQMKEIRDIMQRQVRQLIRFSDDLLDAARISQGRLELRRQRIELRALVDNAVEQVRPFIDRGGHAVTVTAPDEPVVVNGDASRLLQVFANLIQNAAKFTARCGSLWVTVETHGESAVVRVRDNGAGIENPQLSTIFESPRPLGAEGAAPNDGLGIGLRLVKAIVDLHGGAVSAHSEGPGRGSEFCVRLPLPSGDERRGLPAEESRPARNGDIGQRPPTNRILVLEEDRFAAEQLSRLLQSIGHDVAVAADGAEAVQMVLCWCPEIVMLDIVTAGGNGCEVARQLRGRQEHTGIVLIALSDSGDEESRRRALDAGFDRCLVKPVSLAALSETLSAIP